VKKPSCIFGKPRKSLMEINKKAKAVPIPIIIYGEEQRAIYRAIHILKAVNTSPAHAASWSRSPTTARTIKRLERIVNTYSYRKT